MAAPIPPLVGHLFVYSDAIVAAISVAVIEHRTEARIEHVGEDELPPLESVSPEVAAYMRAFIGRIMKLGA